MKVLIISCIIFTLSFVVGGAQEDNQTQTGIIEISDDIIPYNGSIGPGSALYGIKLAFENLDESFTFNSTGKLEKQEFNARLRIGEAKSELKQNRSEDAEIALDRFREKIRETEDLVSEFQDKDPGLLQAQKMNVKNQFVLARLLESHPNVTGLQSAFNDSVELEDRFALRTGTILARINSEDHQQLRLREVEEERIKIRARITDNASDIRVDVSFLSTSTERDAIAQEILERFRLSKANISSMLDMEVEREDLQRELVAKAEIRNNISSIESEFGFPLNVTSRTEIIDGIFLELSNLKKSDILDVLDIKSEDNIEINRERESEDLEIKAETFADSSEVKVELEFLTEKNESTTIAQVIKNKLNLRREEIDKILKLEAKDDKISLRENLDIEVDIENGVRDLKLELMFPLDTTGRSEIVERIYQRLSTLTISGSDLEFRDMRDSRRENIQEDRLEDGQEDRKENRSEDRQKNRSDDRIGRAGDNGKSEDNEGRGV